MPQPFGAKGAAACIHTLCGLGEDKQKAPPMSFFKKLRDKMFRSSDKIGAGLEDLVAGPPEEAAAPAEKPGLLGRLLGRDENKRVLRA